MNRAAVAARHEGRTAAVLLRAGVVGLTLATAAIHMSLGGLLFVMNAFGYTGLALALLAPPPVARIRPLIRLALLAFTGATIGGWLLFGARIPIAYFDKAIEITLVVLLVIEIWRVDGGALGLVRWGRRCLADLAQTVGGRA
jgi:hypothetical protein